MEHDNLEISAEQSSCLRKQSRMYV